jgi:hypothetical protein
MWSGKSWRTLNYITYQQTYPLTGTFAIFAASVTAEKRSKLSSIEQFIFLRVNDSDAAPKIATSVAPAATWKKKGQLLW